MKMQYKTFRTAEGRKVRVRMTEDEIAERTLFRMGITVLPFLTAVLMFMVWLWR